MSAASAVLLARVAAVRDMLDTGTAKRPTGRTYDPDEQGDVDTFDPDFGFSERCKVSSSLSAHESEVGGRTATERALTLHLPHDSEPLLTGDVWTMTAVSDSSSVRVGTVLRVVAEVPRTFAKDRRYDVEVILS